jgi:hypothetical protein
MPSAPGSSLTICRLSSTRVTSDEITSVHKLLLSFVAVSFDCAIPPKDAYEKRVAADNASMTNRAKIAASICALPSNLNTADQGTHRGRCWWHSHKDTGRDGHVDPIDRLHLVLACCS